MTVYAIVKERGRYLAVPENRVGNRQFFCRFIGHLHAAREFAANEQKKEQELLKPASYQDRGRQMAVRSYMRKPRAFGKSWA